MNFLYLIDVYGYQPKMLIDNSGYLKSVFGGILSIIMMICVLWSFWIFGNDIVYKKRPNLVTSTYADPTPMETNFNDNNYIITFGLQRPDFSFFYDEKIYNIKVENNYITRYPNNSVAYETNEIETIRCSQKKFEILYDDYFANLDLNNLACFKNGSFKLDGFFGTKIWKFMYIKIQKCQNSTSNNNHCKSPEEIEKELSGGYFALFVSDQTVIPTNFSYPISTFGVNIWTTFASDVYREVWLYYKKLQIISDIGWLFEDKKFTESFSFDSYKEVWDKRNNQSVFLKLGIGMGLNRVVYERDYLKIQQIAANVGGISKFILFCGIVLIYLYREMRYKSWMVSHFFDSTTLSSSKKSKAQNQTQQRSNYSINGFNSRQPIKKIEIQKQNLSIPSKWNEINLVKNDYYASDNQNRKNKLFKVPMTLPTNNKVESIELTFCETLISPCRLCGNNRRKFVNRAYSKIKTSFQWLKFVKNQNDLELMKEIVLNKEQKDIFDLALLVNDKQSLLVRLIKLGCLF